MVVKYLQIKKIINFMIERYTRNEIKTIWDDYNRYSIWLDIELAAAEAMESLNYSQGNCKKIKSRRK